MFETCRNRAIVPIVLVGLITLTSCGAPSLLITPVAVRRELVETELSRDSLFASDKIAIIDVSGVLMDAPAKQFLGAGEHAVSLLLEKLDKARRDPHVKAVLLRINSPGGGVVASEMMHDELMHFKESGKPLVAVIMDVGASGGYYIACACDEIIAHPSSIVGSIGVIMQMFEISGTLHKLGASADAITSGTFKDTGSPFRKMRPEERDIFQNIVNDMYDRFIGVVDAGRPNLDEAAVRKLADGRVYSATQALKVGLIDRISTMRESIDIVRVRAGLRKVRVVTYNRPLGYRPNYYAMAPHRAEPTVNMLNIDIRGMLQGMTPRFMYLWSPAH